MALERERRFLVIDNDELKNSIPDKSEFIIQMYIVDKEDHSLRIRLVNSSKASICYKYYLDVESKEEHESDFLSALDNFAEATYKPFLRGGR